MITQVTLQNVRIFADEARTFSLKPLTVFCGSNSSGKSTILKIFSLLRQSHGIRESAEEESGKLRFKGTQVDLGNYYSLVSKNDISRNMRLGIRIGGQMPQQLLAFLKFIKENPKGGFSPGKLPDDVVDFELDCSFIFFAEVSDRFSNARDKNAKLASGSLKCAEFRLLTNGETLLKWSFEKMLVEPEPKKGAQTSEEELQMFYQLNLPTALFEKVGMAEQLQPQKAERPDETILIALLRGLLPTAIIADPKSEPAHPASEEEHNWQRWPIPAIIDWQFELFKTALLHVNYVAPLRSPGKRYYVADMDVTPGMDPTGEFLPYILRDKGSLIVQNAHIHSHGKLIKESLSSALSGWLCYLRTGNMKGTEVKQAEFDLDASEILVEVKLKSPGDDKKHSLADSGFGYSQIVPVLVRGLLAPVEGTLVVEQPELHLHPALQVRIADFFLAMCSIGKQVIIETHSEHLVNALRVRAAEDPKNAIHKICKIYFLSSESGTPQVHDLSVQADGSLNEWPESFFGEALSLSGRLLRAQAKSK